MTTIGMYCDVCEKDGVSFEMELVDVTDLSIECSHHTYEGRCPRCGTIYQYISYRKEEDYTFCKKESE